MFLSSLICSLDSLKCEVVRPSLKIQEHHAELIITVVVNFALHQNQHNSDVGEPIADLYIKN